MQRTRQLILRFIERNGEATVESLADAVGLAPVTVRHHLNVLREREMIDVSTRPEGRGRPRHIYRLSPTGSLSLRNGRQYAALASGLIEAISREDDDAAKKVFRELAAARVGEAGGEANGRPIEESLDVAVEILGHDGFSTRWERDGESYLVHELGCPYQLLSDEHHDVCCMDLEILRRVTGGTVTREAWRHDGSAVCSYRVVPSNASKAAGESAAHAEG